MNQMFKYTTVISSKQEQLPLFRRHTGPPTQWIISNHHQRLILCNTNEHTAISGSYLFVGKEVLNLLRCSQATRVSKFKLKIF